MFVLLGDKGLDGWDSFKVRITYTTRSLGVSFTQTLG